MAMAFGDFTACKARSAVMATALLGAAAVLPACAAEPTQVDLRSEISGRVIDAATGAPIEGAVVIATWWTELPPSPAALALGLAIGGHGTVERRTVYVSEALTDRDGSFKIPSWSIAEQWRPGSVTSYSPLIVPRAGLFARYGRVGCVGQRHRQPHVTRDSRTAADGAVSSGPHAEAGSGTSRQQHRGADGGGTAPRGVAKI